MRGLFRGLSSCLPKSELTRNAALLGGGTVLSHGLQVLATLFLAKLYAPNAFGEWALLMSFATVASAVGGLRYELAIVLAEDDAQALSVFALQTVCNSLLSGVVLAVVLLAPSAIWMAIGSQELSPWLYVLPVVVFLTGMTQAVNYWLVRTKQFRWLAFYRLAQTAVCVGTQTLLAILVQGSPSGLVLGSVAGLLVVVGMLWVQASLGYGRLLQQTVTKRSMWQSARKYRNFPKYTVPYGLVGVLRERGLIFLLGIFAGTSVVGLYTQALRLVHSPINLVANSLNLVLYRRAVAEPDVANVAPVVSRITMKMALLAAPAFVFFAWFARDIASLLMGDRWADVGLYGALWAAPAYVYLLGGWMDRMLDVVGRQRVAMVIEVCYSILALAGFAIGFWCFGSAAAGIALVAVAAVLYQFSWLVAVYYLCRFPFTDLARIGLHSLLLASGAGLFLWASSTLLAPSFTPWVGAAGLGVYYTVMLILTRTRQPAIDEPDNSGDPILSLSQPSADGWSGERLNPAA